MPDWRELTRILAETGGLDPTADGPAVASEFERRYGRVQLIEAIRSALHADEVRPGAAHRALAELPFDSVYTTNFDLLLEDSYSVINRPFRSLVGELQMPFHGGRMTTNIVKMHGDLRHEEHIVVTTEDYQTYLDNYPVIATHLSALLITRTALFVGYSLSDPDFGHIRNVVRSRLGKFTRMAYVIAFDAPDQHFETQLADNLHVVSLPSSPSVTKDEQLEEFFRDIQFRIDAEAGAKLRAARPKAFEQIPTATLTLSAREEDAPTLFTSSSNLCFVMMPFTADLQVIYEDLIRPPLENEGLTVLRADEMLGPGSIVEGIRAAIQQSRLCIADLSGRNPNVLYEVGIAHTLGKPTILLAQQVEDIPFDIRTLRTIVYKTTPAGFTKAQTQLGRAIQQVLGEDRLDEAGRLIDSGMYRASVAMIGILLEHSMRQLVEKHVAASSERMHQSFGLGQSLKMLTAQGILESADIASLQRVIKIRNQAVHHLEEPSSHEARFALDATRGFVSKYLIDTI